MEATPEIKQEYKQYNAKTIELVNTKTGNRQEVPLALYEKQYTWIAQHRTTGDLPKGVTNPTTFRERFSHWRLASEVEENKPDLSEGLDDEGLVYLLLSKKILTKKGAWIYHGEEQIGNGMKNAIDCIKENDLTQQLKDELNG